MQRSMEKGTKEGLQPTVSEELRCSVPTDLKPASTHRQDLGSGSFPVEPERRPQLQPTLTTAPETQSQRTKLRPHLDSSLRHYEIMNVVLSLYTSG